MARCPAHADRSPSLSVRETPEGSLLLHCFSGCGAADVVGAVGLELKDLFPEQPEHHKPRIRDYRHVHAAGEALKSLATEATVLQIAADHLAGGGTLGQSDRERLAQAADRIRSAREVAA